MPHIQSDNAICKAIRKMITKSSRLIFQKKTPESFKNYKKHKNYCNKLCKKTQEVFHYL